MPEAMHHQSFGGPSQQGASSTQGFSSHGLSTHGSNKSASEAAVEAFKDYARERPEIVTMWAFGVGFVLGWKLRIW